MVPENRSWWLPFDDDPAWEAKNLALIQEYRQDRLATMRKERRVSDRVARHYLETGELPRHLVDRFKHLLKGPWYRKKHGDPEI